MLVVKSCLRTHSMNTSTIFDKLPLTFLNSSLWLLQTGFNILSSNNASETNAGGRKQTQVQFGLFTKATHRYTIGMVACNLTPSRAAANSLLVWNRQCGGWRTQPKTRFQLDLFPTICHCATNSVWEPALKMIGCAVLIIVKLFLHSSHFMMPASKDKRFQSLFASADVNMHKVLCYRDKGSIMCPWYSSCLLRTSPYVAEWHFGCDLLCVVAHKS